MLTKYVDKKSAKANKRSARCLMTNEARVLKEMREEAKLSMKKAGALVGKSDSYIAHIETGRMEVPEGEKLQRLLDIYSGIKIKSFYEKVREYKKTATPRDELMELVEKMAEEKILTVLNIVKNIF
jgi:transcriptional regulator with XRE-family HTH domain